MHKKYENSSDLLKENFDSKKEIIFAKLPKLEIAKFSGKNSKWLTLQFTFDRAINENKNLDPGNKFNYLKMNSLGNAMKSIVSFVITHKN